MITLTPDEIPATMRALRKQSGITQIDLAGMLFMTPPGLYYWEMGHTQYGERSPRINRLVEWADALGYKVKITLEPKERG